jgi:hypothetical protein
LTGTETKETVLSTDKAVASQRPTLGTDDPRAMLPIEEVAALLDVSVKLLRRQHEVNPAEYPADQVGVLWRIPRWWVERKIACQPAAASGQTLAP